MSYNQWNEDLMTGDAHLDEQHRKLLGMGEELRQNFLRGVTTPRALELMDELLAFATKHFADQEKWLAEQNHSHLRLHHRMHEEVKQKMADKLHAIRKGQLPATSGIAVFLAEWIRRHILEEDRRAISACRQEKRWITGPAMQPSNLVPA